MRIAIIGTGGMGRETLAILRDRQRSSSPPEFEILGFITSDVTRYGTHIDDCPVLGPESCIAEYPDAVLICAIGDPRDRIRVVRQCLKNGVSFASAIHPSLICRPELEFGHGVIVAPNATMTTDVRIGAHVIVNNNVSVSHDCVIDDFVTISPGAVLTGYVHVEYGAELGANCTILPRRTVGRGAIVGAGAVVTTDVAPNTVVAGVPARLIHEIDTTGWL
jgi:sugar O-acyltransferase (sialic acid O-acetyltransferase NeuD family)